MNELIYIIEHIVTGGSCILAGLFLPRVAGNKLSRSVIDIVQALLIAYGIIYGVVLVVVYIFANIVLPNILLFFSR